MLSVIRSGVMASAARNTVYYQPTPDDSLEEIITCLSSAKVASFDLS